MFKQSLIIFMGVIVLGCNDDSFEGNGSKVAHNMPKAIEPDTQDANKDPAPAPANEPEKEPEVVVTESENEPSPAPEPEQVHLPGVIACSKTARLQITATSGDHYDPFSSSAGSHIVETIVVKLPLADLEGSTLPIASFSLDDVAIIVKSSVTIASVLQSDATSRTITVPSDAFMIYDGNRPNDFAYGRLDSYGATYYKFGDKTVDMPAGKSLSLKQVYDGLGAPLVAHNKIEIADLIAKGFKVGDNLEFKIFHVAHARGHVNIFFDIPVCP